MHDRIVARGFELSAVGDAFVGDAGGVDAAWEAFKELAVLPAYDSFEDRYGQTSSRRAASQG
jgi:hypothetical protein